MQPRNGHTELMTHSLAGAYGADASTELPMNDPIGCRDMELLCRQRATFDVQHSWKWLGEAERWKDLAHRETASRFHATHPGPMVMGPNTMADDRRAKQAAAQREGRKSPLE